MTVDEVIELVLRAAEDEDRAFDCAEISEWPADCLKTMKRLGLLRRAGGPLRAPCPDCDGAHSEEVFKSTHGKESRYFIICPERLQVEVTVEMCTRWEPDPTGIASAVADALAMNRSFKELFSQRLWRLGRFPWHGKTREVLFARGLLRGDAEGVLKKMPPAGKAMVLVPHDVPDDRRWPYRVPAVLALMEFVRFEQSQLRIDGVALMDAIDEADQHIADLGQVSLDQIAEKKVKEKVESYLESKLTRVQHLDAILHFGSVDKAVKGLDDWEIKVSRSSLYRDLNKVGGMKKLRERGDSGSLTMLKMSHPGNRGKKFDQARK